VHPHRYRIFIGRRPEHSGPPVNRSDREVSTGPSIHDDRNMTKSPSEAEPMLVRIVPGPDGSLPSRSRHLGTSRAWRDRPRLHGVVGRAQYGFERRVGTGCDGARPAHNPEVAGSSPALRSRGYRQNCRCLTDRTVAVTGFGVWAGVLKFGLVAFGPV